MILNYDYLFFKIKQKGYPIEVYCIKKLGKSHGYLSSLKSQSRIPQKEVLDYMIKDLELNTEALWQKTETVDGKNPVEEMKPTGIPEKSDFEIMVEKMLEEINTKLDLVLEMDEKLNKVIKYLPEKTPQDRADELLKTMLAGRKSCDYDDYLRRLGVIGVGKEFGITTVNEGEYEIKVTGYGNGKKRWVMRKEAKEA